MYKVQCYYEFIGYNYIDIYVWKTGVTKLYLNCVKTISIALKYVSREKNVIVWLKTDLSIADCK